MPNQVMEEILLARARISSMVAFAKYSSITDNMETFTNTVGQLGEDPDAISEFTSLVEETFPKTDVEEICVSSPTSLSGFSVPIRPDMGFAAYATLRTLGLARYYSLAKDTDLTSEPEGVKMLFGTVEGIFYYTQRVKDFFHFLSGRLALEDLLSESPTHNVFRASLLVMTIDEFNVVFNFIRELYKNLIMMKLSDDELGYIDFIDHQMKDVYKANKDLEKIVPKFAPLLKYCRACDGWTALSEKVAEPFSQTKPWWLTDKYSEEYEELPEEVRWECEAYANSAQFKQDLIENALFS